MRICSKSGERLVHIRNTSLISMASPSVRTYKFPANCTVHGRLAAFLALGYGDEEAEHRPWQDVWPSMREFEVGLPLHWDEKACGLLPHAAKGMSYTSPFYQ
jgi:hypothetical protein